MPRDYLISSHRSLEGSWSVKIFFQDFEKDFDRLMDFTRYRSDKLKQRKEICHFRLRFND